MYIEKKNFDHIKNEVVIHDLILILVCPIELAPLLMMKHRATLCTN